MMVIDTNQQVVVVPPGSAVCGIGFVSVMLTYEDMEHPEWLMEILTTRMVPE